MSLVRDRLGSLLVAAGATALLAGCPDGDEAPDARIAPMFDAGGGDVIDYVGQQMRALVVMNFNGKPSEMLEAPLDRVRTGVAHLDRVVAGRTGGRDRRDVHIGQTEPTGVVCAGRRVQPVPLPLLRSAVPSTWSATTRSLGCT